MYWIGLPVAGLLLVAAVLLATLPEGQPPAATDQPAQKSAATAPSSSQKPAAQQTKKEPQPESPSAAALGPDWVPDDARLVVSLTPSRLADRSAVNRLLDAAGPYWQPVLGKVLAAFSLRHGDLRRVTWSASDLANLAARGVVVIEVEPDCDLARLATAGTATGGQFRAAPCRRLTAGDWQQPFALLGPHTIVTGQADVLAALGLRDKPRLASQSLARLIDAVPRQAELSVLGDLETARQAGWSTTGGLERALNVWPAGVRPWQTVWRLPEGLGITLRLDGGAMHSQIDLACGNMADAEAVLAAVARLAPTGKAALAEKVKQLAAPADGATPAAAYGLLLREAVAALEKTRWEQSDTTVRVRTDWNEDFSGIGLLVLDGREELQRDWLSAGGQLIGRQESRLLGGLDDYRRLKGDYPAGAGGGSLLPPETRLSWIATLLPYYDHRDWHERLEFGYAWNAPENEPVTKQVLPEVVNPLFGPGFSADGFPVTHYVGSAGLGEDSGKLPADDARAGMFGFGRQTQPGQLRDGASNTIAIFGVCRECGPWASGGRATARSLVRRPYVNGPDGFGTGQADGMYVGMADGSVRFLAKDVDPRVVEQLVTIAGGEAPAPLAAGREEPASKTAPKPVAANPPDAQREPNGAAPAEATEPKEELPENMPLEIAVRLARPVAHVKFSEVELGNLVRMIGEMSALEIQFDQPSLKRAGVSLDTPITLEETKTTVGRLLDEALDQCGLVYIVRDGRLVVTARP